jgi:hypothetical protein
MKDRTLALQSRTLKVLADEAITDLVRQRERIDAYERQAVYEMALIYDRAARQPSAVAHP